MDTRRVNELEHNEAVEHKWMNDWIHVCNYLPKNYGTDLRTKAQKRVNFYLSVTMKAGDNHWGFSEAAGSAPPKLWIIADTQITTSHGAAKIAECCLCIHLHFWAVKKGSFV